MKKLSPEKRKQVILVLAGLVLAAGTIWFLLLSGQLRTLKTLASAKADAVRRLEQVKGIMKDAPKTQTDLVATSNVLATLELTMATGDLYAWTVNTLRQFKSNYKVEIPQFTQVDGPKEANMFAKFPYKQASLTLAGTAGFYELGRFVSDLENQFPFMQVLNLVIEPAAAANPSDQERLSFKLDLVTLVKPNAS